MQDQKTLEFIKRAKEVHGNRYKYDKSIYKNIDTKLIINCQIHGDFEQRPDVHINRGGQCIKCAAEKRGKEKLLESSNKIIEFFKEKHGDKYDYSLVEYTGVQNNVKIKCKIHGIFEQTPSTHKRGGGCPKCGGTYQPSTDEIIVQFKTIHGDKYDYSLVDYITGLDKVKIICKIHGEFEQSPIKHKDGNGCPKCIGRHKSNNDIIEEFKKLYGDKYNYDEVEYTGANNKIKIICHKHGPFYPTVSNFRKGSRGCPKCSGKGLKLDEHIEEFKKVHGNKYDYSLVNYINAKNKLKIICPEHGEFEQSSDSHKRGAGCYKCNGGYQLNNEEAIAKFKKANGDKYDYSLTKYKKMMDNIIVICPEHGQFIIKANYHQQGRGCPFCNFGFSKKVKLYLINQLEMNDLLTMDPFEIYTIIGQGKLPVEFGSLANAEAGSEERVTTLQELRERFSNEDDVSDTQTELEPLNAEIEHEIIQIDAVDQEVTSITQNEPKLPSVNVIGDLHSLDNNPYATMDKEAFESLVQYKLRKLWNRVLNNDISLETLRAENGGKYFLMIKDLFLLEYNEVDAYEPKPGYSFRYQPNLMQKLTVLRLIKNKSYGNWSGTGAGKTLSFIVASREIDARLTVIIALNSTIKQTRTVIKEVYPNSKVFSDYSKGQIFDRTHHNYLVLNYEKFQQEYSEELFQDLTNNNQIDFVVIDEVHNAKQRQQDEESIRRGVMNRLLGRARERNSNLYTLAMSATPVVNNLFEAKSLLQLMTGLEFADLDTRRTLSNALKIFQQLILNGLRYIPKYDIEMTELTGSNMTNLNIDGGYLLDTILTLPQNNYIAIEKLLLVDKLKSIQPYIRKGVILYSHFTEGFINEIESHVKQLGFSVGTYTGEESIFIREENLAKFISGEIDILIGSDPIGTGVDGLQGVCDRMILLTLPWTDSAYTQLKGRIYRQGSIFGGVEIIIPQVRINLDNGEFWSWDIQRLNVIKNKKTLADAAVDGIVPSRVLPTPATMFKKSQESLTKWKERVNSGNLIETTRNSIQINLYPNISDAEQRQARIQSELSEYNRRGKTTKSSTMHKEFTDNPDSWRRYHALRKERMEQWDEVPYQYIATKIRNRNHKVIDFGCGENLFKDCIPHNEVIAFDHISHNGSIACDMKDVSKWVKNESVDVCVFSLALWGTNYKDYIFEAYRTLNYGGVIHIGEPAKDYETPELEQELKNLIEDVGFKVVGDIERRSKFIYITGIKM